MLTRVVAALSRNPTLEIVASQLALVKQLLDLEEREAARTLQAIGDRYPIVITRDLTKAKRWLRDRH